ncbi:MAG: GtrA family protein [Rubrivivax sp.]|nr:GtrA family protein [Rubrivivax sp.]
MALGVDTGIYVFLLFLGAGWAEAAALGFGAGLIVAYTLSVRYVFHRRRLHDARAEFTIFAVIGALGLLLTEALLWLSIEGLRIDPMSAKLIAAGAVFISNYTLRKLVLFTAPQVTFREIVRDEQ